MTNNVRLFCLTNRFPGKACGNTVSVFANAFNIIGDQLLCDNRTYTVVNEYNVVVIRKFFDDL